jgi:hypothetical protein
VALAPAEFQLAYTKHVPLCEPDGEHWKVIGSGQWEAEPAIDELVRDRSALHDSVWHRATEQFDVSSQIPSRAAVGEDEPKPQAWNKRARAFFLSSARLRSFRAITPLDARRERHTDLNVTRVS